MRSILLRVCTFIGVTAVAVNVTFAEEVQGKILAHKGDVKVDGKAAQEKIKPGQIIQTGDESLAAFSPVPSQILVLGKNTTYQTKKLELVTQGGKITHRESTGVLRAGYIQCSLWKPEEGTTSMRITVPWGVVAAVGTSWGTWVSADSGQIAVYAGTVTQWINGVEIKLIRGQVAFLEGPNGSGGMRILDLTMGRLINVDEKGEMDSNLIAPGDLELLKTARELYQAGIPAFSASASANDRIAFTELLDQINETLTKLMIPSIPQILEDQLFPEWKSKELKVPIETASQSTPS